MDRTKASLSVLVLLVLGLALSSGGKGCSIVAPAGPRMAMVVRESAKDTPAIGRLITNLRDGPAAKALADKGSWVELFDVDDKDANGQPIPILEKFKPYTPPELLIVAGDRLVKRSPLPVTAAEVVEAAK